MSQIVSIKRVKNNALQGELLDIVQTSGRINVLAKLNKGDDRFSLGSARHAWFPVTMLSLEELGFSKETLSAIGKLSEGEKLEVSMINPSIDGEELAIQVNESITPDEYQSKNPATAAKQLPITAQVAANKNIKTEFDLTKHVGEPGYFTIDGNLIFSRTTVTVKSQVNHVIVDGASFVPKTKLSSYGLELHEPTTVNKNEFADKEGA